MPNPVAGFALEKTKDLLWGLLEKYTVKYLQENGYGAEGIISYMRKDLEPVADAVLDEEIAFALLAKSLSATRSSDELEREGACYVVLPRVDVLPLLRNTDEGLSKLDGRREELVQSGASRLAGAARGQQKLGQEARRDFEYVSNQPGNTQGMDYFRSQHLKTHLTQAQYESEEAKLRALDLALKTQIADLKGRVANLGKRYEKLEPKIKVAKSACGEHLRTIHKHENLGKSDRRSRSPEAR